MRATADPMRRTAFVAGALYLVTFVTSIPALILKGPVLTDADFILGAGGESGVLWAGSLEVLLALACIGTAVVLFPVLRRQSETAALGFVTATSLVAIHDWAFLLGPGLLPAVNAALLGYVLYRSGLVPRVIPTVGLIGAPLLAASAAALPIALWELSLGSWLVAKGFRPQALTRLGASSQGQPA